MLAAKGYGTACDVRTALQALMGSQPLLESCCPGRLLSSSW